MNVLIGPYKEDNSPRQIEIRIDHFDTWGADHTLALIISPLLRQLKVVKQGAPLVDDDDVPDELKSTSAPPKKNDYDVDANHFKRWDWVMDEMIWAMDQIIRDDDSHFCDDSEVNEEASFQEQLSKMKIDYAGMEKYHTRVENGCRLFGKYFQALWD
jgi:hypothetical protein